MVLSLLLTLLGVAFTAALAFGAVRAGALTSAAGAIATVFGSVIVVLAGFTFLALLVLFVVASVLATRYGFEIKERAKVQEGTHGERGVANVLAHIVVPTALVLAAWASPATLSLPALAVVYTSALAFGAADTFASEFGVLAGRARSILTGRSVKPGTNGGVSLIGELWAFVGAGGTTVVGLVLFFFTRAPLPGPSVFLVVGIASGFIGCQADSLLGEVLENRGYLTKGTTNFFAMLTTVVVALLLLGAFGVAP